MSFCLRVTTFLLLVALSPASHPVVALPITQQTTTTGTSQLPQIRALASKSGVLIQWSATLEIPILGFNLFRISNGQTTRLNPSLIAGSALVVRDQTQTYSWLDKSGSLNARYYVESVDLHGNSVDSVEYAPSWQAALPAFQPAQLLSNLGKEVPSESTKPAWANEEPSKSVSEVSPDSSPQTLADQWSIANQPALKIGIRADGWYRITEPQLDAAGFDTSGDAGKLRLFVGGSELAISVSRETGPLGASDSIEFWGQGIDTPTSDTQVYWLINGNQPGLRLPLMGDITIESPNQTFPGQTLPSSPLKGNEPTSNSPFFGFPVILAEALAPAIESKRSLSSELAANPAVTAQPPIELAPAMVVSKDKAPERNVDSKTEPASPAASTSRSLNNPAPPAADRKAVTRAKTARRSPGTNTLRSRKAQRRRNSQRRMRRRNHFTPPAVINPAFVSATEYRERNIYYPAALNGERENFFGPVVGASGSLITIPLHNIETASSAPAQVQVAIQGVTFETHKVNVLINDLLAGTISFVDETSTNQIFSFPSSWLIEGDNKIKLVGVNSSHDTTVAEYVRVTYAHTFCADGDSLQFSLKSNQSVDVDGFSTTNIRVLDVTDPSRVAEVRPAIAPGNAGFALTIPAFGRGKARRIVALPRSRVSQPAWLTLNQPSTLNSGSNAGNLVIVSFKDFLPALAPLVAQRTAQGYTVKLFDVEDVFDEFSYGVHTPQAIKDFISQAKASWSQSPSYLLLVGDASYDPRNYMGFGNLDFVPTKQIDTGTAGTQTAIETASDDWLTDFDGDGIADISVGRLPVRTLSEANLVVSKIVNYSPSNTGNRALLVADSPVGYYFDFEAADDQLGKLLPGTMTVQKIYRRLQPSDVDARSNIIASLKNGQSVTVYSGHGNVDIWGGSIFTTTDATALDNGNRLPLVVVMDCLNGYFDHPTTRSMAEAFLTAPNGGAVASFASSGLTIPDGQHEMGFRMFQLLYGGSSMSIGDASRQAKSATADMDVRRTWILFGDPTLKIR
jgi:hypothetical protein